MNRQHPAEDSLIALALDELAPPAAEEVVAHLSGCEACSATVARLGAALGAYRAPEAPDAPAGVLVDLLAAQSTAAASRISRSGFPVRLGRIAAVAAMGALFVGGFWMGRATERSIPVGADTQARTTLPRPLPAPPAIDFSPDPSMEIWFATVRGGDSSASASGGQADSL